MPESLCARMFGGKMGISSLDMRTFNEIFASMTDADLEDFARISLALRRGGGAEPNEEELQEEVKTLEEERRKIRNSRAV